MEYLTKKYNIRQIYGKYCLDDIAEKIIKSKSVKKYIHKFDKDNKEKIGKLYYVTKEILLKTIKNSTGKYARKVYNDVIKTQEQQIDGQINMINIEKKMLIYNGVSFIFFKSYNHIWFRAKSAAKYLKYKDPKKAIQRNVEKINKIKYGKLKYPLLKKNNKKSTIFINEIGLETLIMKTQMCYILDTLEI